MDNATFCRRVQALIGQPYSETDCIGVVRKAAQIRCQGTNWLWRSYESRGSKYQYLTSRMDRPPAANELINGLLVFRIKWNQTPQGYDSPPNCHHVGVIIGNTVIQSQEGEGVYKKPYNIDEWNGCGWLKQIERPRTMEDYELTYGGAGDDTITPAEPEPDPFIDLSDHDMIKAIYNRIVID